MNASGVSSTSHLSSLYGTYTEGLGPSAALPAGPPPSAPAAPSVRSHSTAGYHINRTDGSHRDKQGATMVNQEVTMVNLDNKQKEDKSDPHKGRFSNIFV